MTELAMVDHVATLATTTDAATLLNDWLATLDVADDTRAAYRRAVQAFMEWVEQERPGPVTPAVIRNWRDNLARAPGTINLYLSAMRSFFDWAVEAGHVVFNPAQGVKGATRRGTSQRHKRDELTASEVKAVLATCDDASLRGIRDRAVISLMAHTAIRTVEAYRANVDDLETRQGRLVLWVQGKGHQTKDDFVVIPPAAEADIRPWLAVRPRSRDDALFVSLSPRTYGRRLSRQAIRAAVKARYQAAGIVGDRKTTHSLRHSAISQAIRAGATPTQAQAMARHANVNTTLIYYHELGRLADPAEDLIQYN